VTRAARSPWPVVGLGVVLVALLFVPWFGWAPLSIGSSRGVYYGSDLFGYDPFGAETGVKIIVIAATALAVAGAFVRALRWPAVVAATIGLAFVVLETVVGPIGEALEAIWGAYASIVVALLLLLASAGRARAVTR
jgi:hypothetical protein